MRPYHHRHHNNLNVWDDQVRSFMENTTKSWRFLCIHAFFYFADVCNPEWLTGLELLIPLLATISLEKANLINVMAPLYIFNQFFIRIQFKSLLFLDVLSRNPSRFPSSMVMMLKILSCMKIMMISMTLTHHCYTLYCLQKGWFSLPLAIYVIPSCFLSFTIFLLFYVNHRSFFRTTQTKRLIKFWLSDLTTITTLICIAVQFA